MRYIVFTAKKYFCIVPEISKIPSEFFLAYGNDEFEFQIAKSRYDALELVRGKYNRDDLFQFQAIYGICDNKVYFR